MLLMPLITALGFLLFLVGLLWFLWFLCWKRCNRRGEVIPIPFDFVKIIDANIAFVFMFFGIVIAIASLRLWR